MDFRSHIADHSMQALWSYTSEEILLDCDFDSMISHRNGRWQVDYSKLSLTVPCHRDSDDTVESDLQSSGL